MGQVLTILKEKYGQEYLKLIDIREILIRPCSIINILAQ